VRATRVLDPSGSLDWIELRRAGIDLSSEPLDEPLVGRPTRWRARLDRVMASVQRQRADAAAKRLEIPGCGHAG
jgi:hypothetical protein